MASRVYQLALYFDNHRPLALAVRVETPERPLEDGETAPASG